VIQSALLTAVTGQLADIVVTSMLPVHPGIQTSAGRNDRIRTRCCCRLRNREGVSGDGDRSRAAAPGGIGSHGIGDGGHIG